MTHPPTKRNTCRLPLQVATVLLTVAFVCVALTLFLRRQSRTDNAVAASVTQFGSTAHAAPPFRLHDQYEHIVSITGLRGQAATPIICAS